MEKRPNSQKRNLQAFYIIFLNAGAQIQNLPEQYWTIIFFLNHNHGDAFLNEMIFVSMKFLCLFWKYRPKFLKNIWLALKTFIQTTNDANSNQNSYYVYISPRTALICLKGAIIWMIIHQTHKVQRQNDIYPVWWWCPLPHFWTFSFEICFLHL